jgi:serine/threonine protein kinase
MMKKKRFTEDEAVEILTQLIDGFKEMHRQGILHRDLKPANILIHQGKMKIADLGFSKQLGPYSSNFTGTILGTPMYMAPQILISQNYTNKCDIWSLGVIAYQFLHDDFPWKGAGMKALANEIFSKPLDLQVPCSPLYLDFVRGCLRVQESDRFSWEDVFNHRLFQQRVPKPITNSTGKPASEPGANLGSPPTQEEPKKPATFAGTATMPTPSAEKIGGRTPTRDRQRSKSPISRTQPPSYTPIFDKSAVTVGGGPYQYRPPEGASYLTQPPQAMDPAFFNPAPLYNRPASPPKNYPVYR